ncbi:hypothetical protein HK104_009166 [Borealophlyctis nickersoniae]|nr:hypothetical protein HK104_009166 [Borealophlyctis nickersoniae]
MPPHYDAHQPSYDIANTPQSRHANYLRKTMNRIYRLFLERRFQEAHSLCARTITEQEPVRSTGNNETDDLHSSLLQLYLKIAEQQPNKAKTGSAGSRVEEWDYVVRWFQPGRPIPAEITICGIFLHLKRQSFGAARDLIELWLAEQSDAFFMAVAEGTPPFAQNYERIVELYVLHVLPKLGDWHSAEQFLQFNDVLSEERKSRYFHHLSNLKAKVERRKAAAERARKEAALKSSAKTEPSPKLINGHPKAESKPARPQSPAETTSTPQQQQQSSKRGVPSQQSTRSSSSVAPAASRPQNRPSSSLSLRSPLIQYLLKGIIPVVIAAVLVSLGLQKTRGGARIRRLLAVMANKFAATAMMGLNLQTM